MALNPLKTFAAIKKKPVTTTIFLGFIASLGIANHVVGKQIYTTQIKMATEELQSIKENLKRDVRDIENQLKLLVDENLTEDFKLFSFDNKKLSLVHSQKPHQKILVNDNNGETFRSILTSNHNIQYQISLDNGTVITNPPLGMVDSQNNLKQSLESLMSHPAGVILSESLKPIHNSFWALNLLKSKKLLSYQKIEQTNLILTSITPTKTILTQIAKALITLNTMVFVSCLFFWFWFKDDKNQNESFNNEVIGFLNYLRFGSLNFQGKFKPKTPTQKLITKSIMDCIYGTTYLKSFLDSDWINQNLSTVTPKMFSNLVQSLIDQNDPSTSNKHWFIVSASSSNGKITNALIESINQSFKNTSLFVYQTSENHFLMLVIDVYPGKFTEMVRRSLYNINKMNLLLASDVSVLGYFFSKKVNVSVSALVSQMLRMGQSYYSNSERSKKDHVFELKNYFTGLSAQTYTWKEILIDPNVLANVIDTQKIEQRDLDKNLLQKNSTPTQSIKSPRLFSYKSNPTVSKSSSDTHKINVQELDS